METELFRKSSLERISSPERLNEYIKITRPGVWAVLLGCLAILAAVFLWGIFGSIPDSVSAVGVIFPQNGVTSVIPVTEGRISDMRVKVGDFVEAGQILAIIPQESFVAKINDMKKDPQADPDQIASLVNDYENSSILISPVSGIVLSAKSTNETATTKEAVVKIVKQEKYANDRQIICYIPDSTARKLKEGMEVQASPDFAPREEYGFMYGHITDIGVYPVSQADILAAVGSEQYAEGLLLRAGNFVEVRVNLTVDPYSWHKIKWSNSKGENLPFSIGVKCLMRIVVKDYKPIELVIR